MKKDFDRWNNRKKELNSKKNIPYFHERDIWWASIGLNVGYEQDGKNKNFERPVLVLKKFGKEMFWSLPQTSQDKTGKFYYQFKHKEKKYSFVLSQLRNISSRRLIRKIGRLPKNDFCKIKKAIKASL